MPDIGPDLWGLLIICFTLFETCTSSGVLICKPLLLEYKPFSIRTPPWRTASASSVMMLVSYMPPIIRIVFVASPKSALVHLIFITLMMTLPPSIPLLVCRISPPIRVISIVVPDIVIHSPTVPLPISGSLLSVAASISIFTPPVSFSGRTVSSRGTVAISCAVVPS